LRAGDTDVIDPALGFLESDLCPPCPE
jgi:hypothetical protein